MNAWLDSTCWVFTPELERTLGMLCAALAVVVVGALALGFLALRERAVRGEPAGSAPRSPALDDAGLLGLWQLSRRLGRVGMVRR